MVLRLYKKLEKQYEHWPALESHLYHISKPLSGLNDFCPRQNGPISISYLTQNIPHRIYIGALEKIWRTTIEVSHICQKERAAETIYKALQLWDDSKAAIGLLLWTALHSFSPSKQNKRRARSYAEVFTN